MQNGSERGEATTLLPAAFSRRTTSEEVTKALPPPRGGALLNSKNEKRKKEKRFSTGFLEQLPQTKESEEVTKAPPPPRGGALPDSKNRFSLEYHESADLSTIFRTPLKRLIVNHSKIPFLSSCIFIAFPGEKKPLQSGAAYLLIGTFC